MRKNSLVQGFFSREELLAIGFKSVGVDVRLSKKASIYGAKDIEVGDNVRIDDFCILSGKITIGNNVHIAAYSAIFGGTEGVFISDFANISSRVSVYSVNDDYSGETLTNPTIPNDYKNVTSAPVYIERHVIIGATSVVLPGVTLKEGSAFGSFSFIKNDSEPWSLNTGVPCKMIGRRKKELLNLEKTYLHDVISSDNHGV